MNFNDRPDIIQFLASGGFRNLKNAINIGITTGQDTHRFAYTNPSLALGNTLLTVENRTHYVLFSQIELEFLDSVLSLLAPDYDDWLEQFRPGLRYEIIQELLYYSEAGRNSLKFIAYLVQNQLCPRYLRDIETYGVFSNLCSLVRIISFFYSDGLDIEECGRHLDLNAPVQAHTIFLFTRSLWPLQRQSVYPEYFGDLFIRNLQLFDGQNPFENMDRSNQDPLEILNRLRQDILSIADQSLSTKEFGVPVRMDCCYAGDPNYIRCAVHPLGTCEGCPDFKSTIMSEVEDNG